MIHFEKDESGNLVGQPEPKVIKKKISPHLERFEKLELKDERHK